MTKLIYLFLFLVSTKLLAATNICLVLTIKNDESVIDACLDSVKAIVTCVCLCDEGSTDQTVQKAEAFCWAQSIPYITYHYNHRESTNYRQFGIESAVTMLKDLYYPLEQTYLLFLDPDMIIKAQSHFKIESLTEDGYLVMEKSPLFSYHKYNIHLIRASLNWKCSGLLQDSWSCNTPYQIEKSMALQINANGDEGYRKQKISREIAILTKALREDSNNTQYMFYLAQAHKSLGHYDEAIKWYHILAYTPAEKEHMWFCKYMMAECFEAQNRWDQALYWYLEAFQSDPDRSDSLKNIAVHYRLQAQNDLSYLFSKAGSYIPYPKEAQIFGHPPLYDYEFNEELSITSYYTRFKNDGYAASNELILNKNTPWYIKEQTYRNLTYYVHPLPNTHYATINVALPLIRDDSPDRFNPMNPSIQKTGDGYKVICRAVNYTQMGAKVFNTIDEQGIFRTKNFLLHYDKNFELFSQQEIIELLDRERIKSFNIEGLDDCRIFDWNGESWFTCTTNDTNPTGNFQISLCKLGNDPFSPINYVEYLVPLIGPDLYRCEKNWLPFVIDNRLHVIYNSGPFVMFAPDIQTGACEKIMHKDYDIDFSHCRGSAAPIPFDDGYLMMVHEVVHLLDWSRIYYHRFLFLDANFEIKKASKPFIFKQTGVEYCCSMVFDHANENLIMAIGIEDKEAYLGFVDLQTIRSFLEPLPKPLLSPFLQ